MNAHEKARDVAQRIDGSCSAKGHSPVDDGQDREWPCACSECWAEAIKAAQHTVLMRAAKSVREALSFHSYAGGSAAAVIEAIAEEFES
jgi:hypothetical protein